MEDVIYDSDEDEGLDGDDDDDAERDAFAEDAVDEDGQPVTPKSKRRRTDGQCPKPLPHCYLVNYRVTGLGCATPLALP